MRKTIYTLHLLLVVACGFVLANCNFNNDIAEESTTKQVGVDTKNEELKKWEATPAGISFKKWQASPIGKKVLAGAAKIQTRVKDSVSMEAMITSLSLPPGSRLGYGMMVNINGEEYILSFGVEKTDEFNQLHNLKVNDKIMLKAHGASYAPKYAYPIINGRYVEKEGKVIFKRAAEVDGC